MAIDKQMGLRNIDNLYKQMQHRYFIKDCRLNGLKSLAKFNIKDAKTGNEYKNYSPLNEV